MFSFYLTRLARKISRTLKLPFIAKSIRVGVRLIPVLILMDLGYLIGVWPDWTLYQEGPIQSSSFIRSYVFEQYRHRDWPDLRWQPVPINKISRNMIRALIVAEDARFYEHSGVDLDALKTAMEHNLSEKRLVVGGSTISQQMVKNVFLSPSRNPLRKWHELVLTVGMERNLTKKRILELYLNIVEFGRGIYGVEAAAQYYWGVSAYELTTQQAIMLAASLPAPVLHNPDTQTDFFKRRVKKIQRYF